MSEVELVVDGAMAREAIGSTGIGHGIAIPHCRVDIVKNICCAYGHCPEGLDFDSLDGEPVYSVFLLLTPPEMKQEHLELMKSFASQIRKDHFCDFLRQASDAEQLHQLLEEFRSAHMISPISVDLSPYMSEERILFLPPDCDKSTALTRLAQLLGIAPILVTLRAFLQAIFDREQVSLTGIGNGLAVPHAKLPCVDDFMIAVGICPEGIEFAATDGKPVQILLRLPPVARCGKIT